MAGATPARFGALLREYRAAAGLSQEALAERAGLSARGIQDLERGARRAPRYETLRQLVGALGLSGGDRAVLEAAARHAPEAGAPAAPEPPHNLPLQLTGFVGRERELAAVAALLSAHRLVTLTGPGGVGKTRLALQAAADALEASPDGVWLAELAPLADPALVPQAVAGAVGVREEPGQSLPATLADALRPKRLLLVLDNCEHLVAACARLADALLRACPHIRVLATSRAALGLGGEVTWRVPSLTLPDVRHPPVVERLTHSEAVRLFVDRARAVHPAFAVTSANAPAVAAICRRLDGLPLALELAAARVRVLPPEQLLARLDDRFRLLTGGSRTALERHETLQAAVDWSYALLSEPERLFDGLSVFAGGWTLEAAEAVCAGDGIEAADVLELLTRLVDQSLVLAEAQPDGTARYRLLETLRQYGQQRLAAPGAAAGVAARHAAYYLAWAERAGPALDGAEQPAWLDRLERDHDNLRGALRWALAHDRIEPGLRAAGAVWPFWNVRGHRHEGRAWLAALLGAPGAAAAAAGARAGAARGAGRLAWAQHDHRTAGPLFEQALALSRELGDQRGAAHATVGLGLVAARLGELGTAQARFEAGLAALRPLADAPGIAFAIYCLGGLAQARGDLERGRELAEQALRLRRQAGDGRGVATSLSQLAQLARRQGDRAGAARFAQELLTRSADLGYRVGLASAHRALGRLAQDRGDYARARAHYARALDRHEELGNRDAVASTVNELASLAAAEGHAARAVRLAGAAAALREALGQPAYLQSFRDAENALWLEPARQAVGAQAATAAWAAGQAMPLEQAIAFALDEAPAEA